MKKFSDSFFSVTNMFNRPEVLIRTTHFGYSTVQPIWSILGLIQDFPSTGNIIARTTSMNLFFFNDKFSQNLKSWAL